MDVMDFEDHLPNRLDATTMTVGIARLTLRLPGNTSLKGKRKVVKSVIEKVRHKFRISVAEIGAQDKLQRAVFAMAVVGNDSRTINSVLDRAIDFVESMNVAELVEDEIDLFAL